MKNEEEAKAKVSQGEGKEEEDALSAHPPPELWAYKPCEWDDEELHSAYKRNPHHQMTDYVNPPNEIEIILVDTNGRPELSPRRVQASYKEEKFDLTGFPDPILYANYRYVSTKCQLLCEDYVEDTRFMILLSVRLLEQVMFPEDCDIFNYFIKPKSADDALNIINFFQFHIAWYFRKKTEENYPTIALEYIRPKVLLKCQVQVHWRKHKKTWSEERIVVVDPECVAFYRKSFSDVHKPRDCLFFWLEQYRKAICKVSRIKSEKRFFLHSLFMFATIQYEEDSRELGQLEKAFSKITSATPRKAFENPKIFYHWLQGNYDPETEEIHLPQPKVMPVNLDPKSTGRLDQVEKNMQVHEPPVQFPEGDQRAQLLWTNTRPMLEDCLAHNKLPQVKDLHISQNPNDVEGLDRAVNLIKKVMLEEINYIKALAITVAMKDVYQKSDMDRIREMVMDSPINIMHRIFTRGHLQPTQEDHPPADVPQQEYDEGRLEEEEEDMEEAG